MQAVPPANNGVAQPAAPVGGGGDTEAQSPGGLGSSMMLLAFIPLLLFMFWQSRSQQKKQETAIAGLKKGDRVVTQSGLIGRLVEVDSRVAKLELAPGVKVQVLRNSLTGRDEDPAVSGGKSDKEDGNK